MADRKTRRLALHSPLDLYYDGLHQPEHIRGEVKTAMHNQTISKTLVLLLAVCCLVPLAALAAVLYLAAPVWLVAPAGLLAVVLLARRLMRLLTADDSAGLSRDLPLQRRHSTNDHDWQ